MSINECNHIGGDEVELIQVIKALSDETRLRILNLLRHGNYVSASGGIARYKPI